MPSVLAGVARMMRSFREDETIQHYGAEALCALNGIEVRDVIAAHGAVNYATLYVTTIEMATLAPHPVTLMVSGRPWNALIMELYPQRRSQARE